MRETIEEHLAKLRDLYDLVEVDFPDHGGADEKKIEELEARVGFPIDSQIKDLWRLFDGSDEDVFFSVSTHSEEQSVFLSVEACLSQWEAMPVHSDLIESYEGYEEEPPRDPRVKEFWSHKKWLPVGDANGGSIIIWVDHDPGPGGRVGQVIAFQHDPDAVFYIGPDLVSLLEHSFEVIRQEPRRLIAGEWWEVPDWEQAIREDNVEKLRQLIEAGFNIEQPDDCGRSALENAAFYRSLKVVRFLHERGATPREALRLARRNRDLQKKNKTKSQRNTDRLQEHESLVRTLEELYR